MPEDEATAPSELPDLEPHGTPEPTPWWPHDDTEECHQYGCTLHAPTLAWTANKEDWPHVLGEDGKMYRTCPHGINHVDIDQDGRDIRMGENWMTEHQCDGCCWNKGVWWKT